MATPVFVGRQRELALLSDLAVKARADQPQVVLIEGEAGMGKSSLIAKVASALSGAVVLRASGEQSEYNFGYGVIGQIASAARSLGVATPALLGSQLSDSLDPLAVGAELLSLFDALGSQGQVVLLLVDDLHWSDPLSARALLFGLRRLGADRVLAAVTSRPGELAHHGESWYRFFAGDQRATRIQLGPMTLVELVKLSREMGAGELSRRAAVALLEHTGGNPLYCVAVLQELGAERLDQAHGPPRVPRDLASLVLVRVARLGPPARELVTAAAVLGQRCPLALAVQLAGLDDPVDALDQAVNASLLAEGPGELGTDISFVHPLVWSAVYHDLGPARRRQLHKRAAGLLKGERSLAHRVAAATGPDEALAADLEAMARDAAARAKTTLAASLFAQAANMSPDPGARERCLLDALEAYLAGGDVVEAESLAPLVERAAPSARRGALLANLDLFAGRLARAEERLAEVWQAHDQDPGPLSGAVCEQVTVSLIFGGMQGRVGQSILWGRRAVAASPGEHAVHKRALGLLSLALVSGYQAKEALSLPDYLPAPVGNVTAEDLDALILRGIARLWAGYPELAYPDLAHAAARLRGGSSARYAGLCLTYLAGAEYLLGAWDDALAHAELSVALVRDAGYAMWSAIAHHYAALVPAGRGDFAAAARHIEAAHSAEASLGRAWAGAVTAEAVLAMARGAPDDALRAATRVREEWKANWFGPVGLLDWRSLEVEALLALGDVTRGAQRLDELEAVQGEEISPLASTGTARLRALLAIARGDRAGAAEAFASAWQHASGLKLPLVLAQLEVDEARFLRQNGQRDRALARLGPAAARLADLGARPYAQICDQELARCEAPPRPEETRRELGLTGAEFAVARAVARGCTNKEAANELYVSVKTIEFHLSHVYMKLGARSRRELARLLEGAQPAQRGP
ncbi:MAG TPA: AAA family ATPase [Acidimicrobiales bacterium]|nr:AAA family ATPase [Acidimicrobiales bacterium]